MLPKVPVGDAASGLVDWIEANLGWLLDHVTLALRVVLNGFHDFSHVF